MDIANTIFFGCIAAGVAGLFWLKLRESKTRSDHETITWVTSSSDNNWYPDLEVVSGDGYTRGGDWYEDEDGAIGFPTVDDMPELSDEDEDFATKLARLRGEQRDDD